MEVSFPRQVKHSMAGVLEAIKKHLEADKLAIEVGGRVIVIPWASVQYIELAPVPTALPFGVIKGARVRKPGARNT
jgi:hypothetical protein